MVEFKANISDPKSGKTVLTLVKGHHANSLIGKRIGDEFDGIFVGLPGYKLVLTGGTDKDGFPMRPDLPGMRRKKILVSKGIGFNPDRNGTRRRKNLVGNTVSQDIILINMRITSHGSKPMGDLVTPVEKKK